MREADKDWPHDATIDAPHRAAKGSAWPANRTGDQRAALAATERSALALHWNLSQNRQETD